MRFAAANIRQSEADGPEPVDQRAPGADYPAVSQLDQSIEAYRRYIADIESGGATDLSAKAMAGLYCNLANAALGHGDLTLAAANYKSALRLAPQLPGAWCNLGTVYVREGYAEQAIAFYLQALSIDRGHWPSRTNLAQALIATKQFAIALALLVELTTERPDDASVRKELGKLHLELNDVDLALECFNQAAALNPYDAETIYWIGGLRQQKGELEAAAAAYLVACDLQPLIKRPATDRTASLQVLVLYAPFAGNTPPGYLLQGSAYETNTLAVLDGREYDLGLMRQSGQVVVNLISDADQAEEVLPTVAFLVDRLGMPIVNHPEKILRTTREGVARLLDGIPGCRIPKILRYVSDDTGLPTLRDAIAAFAMPMLVRPAGTHGGDDFEKFESLDEIAAFVGQHPGCDHYLIEYVDYRSLDGYFRKYRFVFIGGEILPYHLAIGTDWKLHHDNTRMADFLWMQREEEMFLADPTSTFNAGHYEVLRTIGEVVDLEYFGIDCGLDAEGNIVVFEANASMLVHAHNEKFPYKAPYVQRIKASFDGLLQRLANGSAGARIDELLSQLNRQANLVDRFPSYQSQLDLA